MTESAKANRGQTQIGEGVYRFAWISVAAALLTIFLKFGAWWVTDSVGMLSDALESFVNLIGALAALAALWYASREPDEELS